MDPNATYKMMVESLLDYDLPKASEYALILKEWIDKGGFEPNPIGGFDFDNLLRYCLAASHLS